jgi:hypothetical protein
VTVESPMQMYAARDPRTRQVTAALRLYGPSAIVPQDTRATLYLPNVTRWLILRTGSGRTRSTRTSTTSGVPPWSRS